MRAKLKVVVGTFTTYQEADDFANTTFYSTYSYYVLVSKTIVDRNGKFQCTLAMATECDAVEFVLNQKSASDVEQIAKYAGVNLRGGTTCHVALTKKDVQKMIDNGKLNDEKYSFIRHNLDNLFSKGNTQYRKTVFKQRGFDYYKKVWKSSKLNKSALITRLLTVASNFNYADHAWEIAVYFN